MKEGNNAKAAQIRTLVDDSNREHLEQKLVLNEYKQKSGNGSQDHLNNELQNRLTMELLMEITAEIKTQFHDHHDRIARLEGVVQPSTRRHRHY